MSPAGNHERPSWSRLYEIAEPQAGYFTLGQARDAGYSAPLIEYHRSAGRLGRVARGIFRLTHFPADDHEEFVVVWLWSGCNGVFSHETALMLLDLSDALPSQMHLTVPRTWRTRRLRPPQGVRLAFADLAPSDQTWVGPVPVTRPLRTVVDCAAASADPIFIEQAIAQSERRGLFSRDELERAFDAANLRPPARPRRRGR